MIYFADRRDHLFMLMRIFCLCRFYVMRLDLPPVGECNSCNKVLLLLLLDAGKWSLIYKTLTKEALAFRNIG